jgi:hypothetical protein
MQSSVLRFRRVGFATEKLVVRVLLVDHHLESLTLHPSVVLATASIGST